MTTVSTKDAAVLTFLARNPEIPHSEWEELSNLLAPQAKELAKKIWDSKVNAREDAQNEHLLAR